MKDYLYITKISGSTLYRFHLYLLLICNLWRTLFCQLLFFLVSKEKRELIISDSGSYWSMIKALAFYKYYRTIFYHRIGPLSYLISWLLPGDSTIIIPFSTKIGSQCQLIHSYGSHLNAVSIGDKFSCYQHVVIGSKGPLSGRPVIGNNVTIGTGAVIVGDISIGNNVKIAANAFINKSLPDNCVVMGNPGKIVKKL